MNLLNGVLSNGGTGRLTGRELDLLSYLAARPGQTVSRRELTETAFGYAPTARSRAVDKAMYSLRRKVERDPRDPEHFLTCVGSGYRFVPLASVSRVPVTDRSALVGRSDDVRRLMRTALLPGVSTICGPVGVGKTQLVLSTLSRVTELPVAWCDLDGATEPAALEDVLSNAMSGHLRSVLDSSAPPLVVLDDVVATEAVSRRLLRWSRDWPRVAWVVTGTAPLGIPHERVQRLQPLAEPAALEVLSGSADRYGYAVRPDEQVIRLVRRLDGLPAALQLAGRQIGPFGVRDLLQQLDSGAFFLEPLRRRWSEAWDRLQPIAQRVLGALAARDGDASLSDMLALGADHDDPRRCVAALVEQSWVWATHSDSGVRYRVPHVTRRFLQSVVR